MKNIASAANPRYKALLQLRDKAKARAEEGRALLDGIHLVQAYYQRYGAPELLAVSKSAAEDEEILRLLEALEADEVLQLDDALFGKLSTVDSPTGIIAAVKIHPPGIAAEQISGPCVLLEDIQDPGNLGTLLRTAAAAGISDVLLSPKCADAWSPRVLRAGMGAHFQLQVHEHCDLAAFATTYAGRVIAASLDAAKSLYETDLVGDVAFVFGNEGAGLSGELLTSADERIYIPMAPGTESLNVGAAAAVCLFERARQLS